MALELVNNTTKQGLFNRLKGLYNFIERAASEALDDTHGFRPFVNDIYTRYTNDPNMLGDAFTPLLNTFNTKFANAVTLARSKGVDTIVGMVSKELEIIDNNLEKSIRAVIQRMIETSNTVGRPSSRQINITAASTNTGVADILVTDLVPLPWGAPGLPDPKTGVAQHVDKAALTLYETIEVQATRSENIEGQEIPAEFSVIGDLARDPSNDFTWLDGGSGAVTTIRMVIPESDENFIANGSFENISDVEGPINWSFYNRDTAWGGTKPWYYSNTISSHKVRSLVIASEADGDNKIYTLLRRPLEPYKVYFLMFDAYATADMPSNTKMTIAIKDSSGQSLLSSDPAVGFYNSDIEIPFGGTGNIPENTSSFGTVVRVIVTNNKILKERAYRIEFGVKLGTGETWPSGGKVYIDRVVLVPAIELYPLGLSLAIIGGKSKTQPVRLNDKWVIHVTASTEVYEYWHFVFQHLFNIRSMRLQLPMSGSPTITKSSIE